MNEEREFVGRIMRRGDYTDSEGLFFTPDPTLTKPDSVFGETPQRSETDIMSVIDKTSSDSHSQSSAPTLDQKTIEEMLIQKITLLEIDCEFENFGKGKEEEESFSIAHKLYLEKEQPHINPVFKIERAPKIYNTQPTCKRKIPNFLTSCSEYKSNNSFMNLEEKKAPCSQGFLKFAPVSSNLQNEKMNLEPQQNNDSDDEDNDDDDDDEEDFPGEITQSSKDSQSSDASFGKNAQPIVDSQNETTTTRSETQL